MMAHIAEMEKSMSGKVEALRNRILAEIGNGTLPENSRIPSRNQLVRKYGFSRSTVDRTISMLTAEGRLSGKRGSGTFVLPPPDGAIRKLFISDYDEQNTGARMKNRFFRTMECPVPMESIYEDDVPLHFAELTRPGAAMIWYCPAMYSLYGMRVLEQAGIPQLLINRDYLNYDSIATDQNATMHDALTWLLIEGGRDLAVISYQPTPDRPYLYERTIAFFECAARLGGRFGSNAIHFRDFLDPAQEIAETGRILFAGNLNVRSIAVLHFDLALPLVTCGLAYEKIPGRDYLLMCFDYVPALLNYPGVCLVRQQFDFMAHEAIRWFTERRKNRKEPFRERIRGELVIHPR